MTENEELTPDQDGSCGELLSSTICVMEGWIESFVKEAGLTMPQDVLSSDSVYRIAAEEALKQQIKLMDKAHFDILLRFHKGIDGTLLWIVWLHKGLHLDLKDMLHLCAPY